MTAALPALARQYPWAHEARATYTWIEASQSAAQRFDFVARAGVIAARTPRPAIFLVHGARDEISAASNIEALYAVLREQYERTGVVDRIALRVFPHLVHQIPSAAEAAELRQDIEALAHAVAGWFARHLNPPSRASEAERCPLVRRHELST